METVEQAGGRGTFAAEVRVPAPKGIDLGIEFERDGDDIVLRRDVHIRRYVDVVRPLRESLMPDDQAVFDQLAAAVAGAAAAFYVTADREQELRVRRLWVMFNQPEPEMLYVAETRAWSHAKTWIASVRVPAAPNNTSRPRESGARRASSKTHSSVRGSSDSEGSEPSRAGVARESHVVLSDAEIEHVFTYLYRTVIRCGYCSSHLRCTHESAQRWWLSHSCVRDPKAEENNMFARRKATALRLTDDMGVAIDLVLLRGVDADVLDKTLVAACGLVTPVVLTDDVCLDVLDRCARVAA